MTAEIGLKWLLRFIGLTTLPTFIALVMPQAWLAYWVNQAQPGTMAGLLVTYLIRILMAMFVLVGVQCFIFSLDIERYLPLIWLLGVGCVLLAVSGILFLFATVPTSQQTGFFWIAFADLAEGLAQGVLLIILLWYIRGKPSDKSPQIATRATHQLQHLPDH